MKPTFGELMFGAVVWGVYVGFLFGGFAALARFAVPSAS